MRYLSKNEETGKTRWNRTRAIKSVDRIIDVNQKLFNIAETLAA